MKTLNYKRYLWLFSLLWPLLLPIGLYLAHVTGSSLFYWLLPIEMYLLLPLLDELLGDDRFNPQAETIRQLERDPYYRLIPLLTVPLYLFTMTVSCWVFVHWELRWFDMLGLVLSLGFTNALAINTAHELGHKNSRLEKWMAKLLLALPAYGHFPVEHNRGHHRNVATPEDSSSARMGEGLYRFMLRETRGAISRACRLERERLERKRRRPWGLANECLQSWLMTLVYYTGLMMVLGVGLLPFLLAQALFAWFQISIANYIEHYGLLRQKGEDGRYLPCRPEHSWNSNRLLSGLVLFNLQRHSDHHANAGRRYPALTSDPQAPELPAGYPLMFIVAMFPPIWRRVMDPRLLQHYGHDIHRVHRVDGMHQAH